MPSASKRPPVVKEAIGRLVEGSTRTSPMGRTYDAGYVHEGIVFGTKTANIKSINRPVEILDCSKTKVLEGHPHERDPYERLAVEREPMHNHIVH